MDSALGARVARGGWWVGVGMRQKAKCPLADPINRLKVALYAGPAGQAQPIRLDPATV